MAYFETIKYIPYPVNGKYQVLKDITLNVRFKKEFIENINIYAEYDIEENETLDIIAEKLYQNPNLYWILMLFNQRYDYVRDFPLSNVTLSEYITKKYGEGNEYEHHILNGKYHYETPDGMVVDKSFPNAKKITNFEYEFKVNESKRRIKIVDPRLISQIETELEALMQDGN